MITVTNTNTPLDIIFIVFISLLYSYIIITAPLYINVILWHLPKNKSMFLIKLRFQEFLNSLISLRDKEAYGLHPAALQPTNIY